MLEISQAAPLVVVWNACASGPSRRTARTRSRRRRIRPSTGPQNRPSSFCGGGEILVHDVLFGWMSDEREGRLVEPAPGSGMS